ncbi:MAG: phage Gp37/Gp68 family protein [Treponema sp.]|nr:phage Gp37/Gp68 family protein [Treponema sp.]
MNKTKIDWADRTWNPVTGCKFGCPYCYAKKHAQRFAGGGYGKRNAMFIDKYKDDAFLPPYVLDEPQLAKTKIGWYREAPYPFGFEPTLHRYRLKEPAQEKKPQNIFVCSMADLFGDWVPDEWIKKVLKVCEKAPQHRYLFLTKNPKKYKEIIEKWKYTMPDNFWFGSSVSNRKMPALWTNRFNTFLSIEPLQDSWECNSYDYPQFEPLRWVIIGAETGNRKEKIIPKREWIEKIVFQCHKISIPVFMKNNLQKIWGEPLIQEYPWGNK